MVTVSVSRGDKWICGALDSFLSFILTYTNSGATAGPGLNITGYSQAQTPLG